MTFSNKMIQNLLYAVIGLIFIMFYYLLLPDYHYQALGIFLKSSHETLPAASADEVKLFSSHPVNAEILGNVTVVKHVVTNVDDQAFVFAKAKELVAAQGANGIVLKALGTTATEPGILDDYILMGTAVKTP